MSRENPGISLELSSLSEAAQTLHRTKLTAAYVSLKAVQDRIKPVLAVHHSCVIASEAFGTGKTPSSRRCPSQIQGLAGALDGQAQPAKSPAGWAVPPDCASSFTLDKWGEGAETLLLNSEIRFQNGNPGLADEVRKPPPDGSENGWGRYPSWYERYGSFIVS